MKEFMFKVAEGDSGMRLDVCLIKHASEKKLGLSRSFIKKLILGENVTVDNKPVKVHHRVKAGESICVNIEEPKSVKIAAEKIPLDIVYQDKDLAVINKPIGLVVHPAPGNYEHTLVNALIYHFKDLSQVNPDRPGILHRLDKDTSGLLVIAKNDLTHLELAKQFASHTVKRQYIALVKGSVEFDENVIELPLGRHPRSRKKMSISFNEDAKYAKTHYRTLERRELASLVELNPFTGRTHQLRVHMAFIGHPILGDSKYGKNISFGRLALHAKYVGFMHPTTAKFVEFSTPVPQDFLDWFNKLK